MAEGSRYQQIAHELRTAIADGDWQLGERLPRLQELAAQWQVSTSTIRDAQQVLTREGLLRAVHGRGVFVVAREPATVDPLALLRHASASLDQAVHVMAQRQEPSMAVGEFTHDELALIGRALRGHALRLRACGTEDWTTADLDGEAAAAERLADKVSSAHRQA